MRRWNNQIKTVLLLGALSAAFVGMGSALGAGYLYAFALLAMALNHVLSRAFQALHALWRLVWTVGAGLLLNVLLMPALTMLFGFRGLAFASSISAFVAVGLMLMALNEHVPTLGGALVTRATAAIVGAGVAGGVAATFARGLAGDSALPQVLCGGVVGIAVYATVLFALAPGEARAMLATLAPTWSGRKG